jgi:hypothetical protein
MLNNIIKEIIMPERYVKSTIMFPDRGGEYDIGGIVLYSEDFNYGADADGNRGGYMCFVEDVYWIWAHEQEHGKPIKLTEDEKNLIAEALMDKFYEG